MSKFIIFFKNRRIGEHIFSSEELTIGRAADNDIMLDDPMVTRRHALVKLVGNDYVLSDLGSDVQTLLNGEPVITATLKNNDHIDIDPFRLHCQIEVFESLLQHLSSQINPDTGDTDPRFAQLGSERIPDALHQHQTMDVDEDKSFEFITTIALYGGIVLLILLVSAAIYSVLMTG